MFSWPVATTQRTLHVSFGRIIANDIHPSYYLTGGSRRVRTHQDAASSTNSHPAPLSDINIA
jgi:hypothetical protein